MAKRKPHTAKKLTPVKQLSKSALSKIKHEYENGTPVSLLAAKFNVDYEELNGRILRSTWKRKVEPVIREMTPVQKEFWDKVIKETGELDEQFRVLTFEGLMYIHPEFIHYAKVLIEKYVHLITTGNNHLFTTSRPDLLPEAIESLQRVNDIMKEQFKMVSLMGEGDGAGGISPLQIVYQTTPPNGKAANGHESG